MANSTLRVLCMLSLTLTIACDARAEVEEADYDFGLDPEDELAGPDAHAVRCLSDDGLEEVVEAEIFMRSEVDGDAMLGDGRVLRNCSLVEPDASADLAVEHTPSALTCVAIQVCCWHWKLICGPSKPPTMPK